jgi:hypothetical protein
MYKIQKKIYLLSFYTIKKGVTTKVAFKHEKLVKSIDKKGKFCLGSH